MFPADQPADAPIAQGRARGRGPLVAAIAACVVLVLSGVAVAIWRFSSRDHGPSYPSAWDPRVTDLVEFAASERGLSWQHPVYIDFLDEQSFEDSVTASEDELTDENRRELDDAVASLRAMGLVHGDVDLFSQANELQSGGVLALYDPDTKRVRVKGTELSVAAKVTLVHELTHALQDQNFDLTRLGDFDTDAQNSNFRMIVEGDAEAIEDDYVKKLSESDRQAYSDERKAQSDTASERLGSVPDVLQALFGAPYQLGPPFVATVRARGGNLAVDDLERTPPETEAQILDLAQYLAEREPVPVDEPAVPDGAERMDGGDFGALGWLVVLGERIDPRDALRVVDGWAGDSNVSYRSGDKVCVAVRYRGVTPADTDRAERAIREWAAAMPSGAATVTRNGEVVDLMSCDPGADSQLQVEGNSTLALAYPTTRLQMEEGLFKQVADSGQTVKDEVVLCVARTFVDTLTPAEMRDQSSISATEAQQRVANAAMTCRR